MTAKHMVRTDTEDGRRWEDAWKEAVSALQQALPEPPRLVKEEIEVAERAVVRLRDELIEQLRRRPEGRGVLRRRRMLKQVNAALSLIVGVEYPAGGVQRQWLEQVRDAIMGLGPEEPS
jgi:hypothetical protein